MNRELVTNPNIAEERLRELLELYRKLPVSTFETYSYFGIPEESVAAEEKRAKEKEAFLSGEIRNPSLNFPILELSSTEYELIDFERDLLDFMAESTDLAHDQVRETGLYDIFRIRLMETYLLMISKRLVSTEDEALRADLATRFNMANDEVHGTLRTDRFNGLLQTLRQQAGEVMENSEVPEAQKEAAIFILQNTGEVQGEIEQPVEVSKEVVKKLAEAIRNYYSDLIELVPEKDKYSIEEVAEIFKKAHEIRETGWGVRVQPGQSNVDSRQSEQVTVIGADREEPNYIKMVALLLHEMTHTLKRVNGDKSGDPLLMGLGLPRSLDSEEGQTAITEQVIKGKQTASGRQYYLGLGLARGLDGQPRDFRGTYEIEWRRLVLGKKVSEDLTDDEIGKLKKKAYRTCERIFRGTPCDLPGVVYTKDQAYYNGNQLMWPEYARLADQNNQEQLERIEFLLAAKFDATNPLHIEIVKKELEKKNGE